MMIFTSHNRGEASPNPLLVTDAINGKLYWCWVYHNIHFDTQTISFLSACNKEVHIYNH